MPFLALLQGTGVVVEAEDQQQQQHDGCKRHAFARAISDLDLLESCVTQVVAPAAAASAPVASRTERRRKRPRPRARAAPPPEKRRKAEEAESQRMTHIAAESNRRRLMNHLASLRSLIPSSYIPRGTGKLDSAVGKVDSEAGKLDSGAGRLDLGSCVLVLAGGGCVLAVEVAAGDRYFCIRCWRRPVLGVGVGLLCVT